MEELPTPKKKRHFVQTSKATHEDWYKLTVKHPKASAVLHYLVANAGHQNAVIISQKNLAAVTDMSLPTLKRAVKELKEGNWIETRYIGATGSVLAYIINARVAWSEKRELIGRTALFKAEVIISSEDQPDKDELGNQADLHRFPAPEEDEEQLPSGDGLPPPAEPPFPDMLPDLPEVRQTRDLDSYEEE